jgi:predicted DCC family thiol-disulfide oxidoreductase YuxK
LPGMNTETKNNPPVQDNPRPVLVYDGDCGFCYYWAEYWRKLTGDRVVYEPYQQAAMRYPAIPLDEFRKAVQYIAPDGNYASAAEASFLTLSHAPGRDFWLALYRNLPGFAAISEAIYAFIAKHRPAFHRISLLLWGKDHEPPRHELVSWLFLRLFGLVYLSAFVSFGVQAQGLIGSHGILPLQELVDAVSGRIGPERFFMMPMVFWCDASDFAISGVCWLGALLSLLLVFNVIPRLSLLLIYVLYLSLAHGGQDFMTFQWDSFLLETGVLALLLCFATTPGIWLLRLLLFRFMFMSGVVKLLSGDPNWWNLSALSYHFFSQPLPTPLAWYASQLSPGFLTFATGAVFFAELALPFFIFCPRRLCFAAAAGFLLLEAGIFLTGNYNWFNLHTMVLCLALFDDAALKRLLPEGMKTFLQTRLKPPAQGRAAAIVATIIAPLIVFCGFVQMDVRFDNDPPVFARAVAGVIQPFEIVSPYGLFAVMTTQRREIVIEGSADGIEWKEYEFRYKPGDLARQPLWNISHQPRLDWQMWFAALEDPRRLPWFARFLRRLLENEPAVAALLEKNPFIGKSPMLVRAQFYEYTWASPEDRAKGIWWSRRPLGLYFPAVRLQGSYR